MRASLFVAIVSAVVAGACSSSSPGAGDAAPSCPNDLPPSCPTPTPSYSGDIAGIMDAHCTTCHGPGGDAADKPLLVYDDVFRQRSAVLDQVYHCLMPPPDQRPMTPQQRANLLAWLVCGSPNN
jgi:hypothetical protein